MMQIRQQRAIQETVSVNHLCVLILAEDDRQSLGRKTELNIHPALSKLEFDSYRSSLSGILPTQAHPLTSKTLVEICIPLGSKT